MLQRLTNRPMFRAPYASTYLFGLMLFFGHVNDASAGSSDASAAQALFDDAKAEMARGDYRLACSKLEESQRLDPALGTLLNLADCLEKQGKIATAWSAFREAEGLAHRNGPAEAESVAHERAAALEQRVPRLVIASAAGQPSDLRVTRNGVAVGAAQLGTAIPLDPGEYRVVAWAPGYQRWQATVNLRERAGTSTLAVPLLTKDPEAPPTSATQVTRSKRDTEAKNGPPVAAWAVGGGGVAAIGVSIGLGLWAKSQYRSADCPDHVCQTDADYRERQHARTKASVATVVFIGGAVALGSGIVIWTLSPSQPQPQPQRPRASLSLAVQAPGLVLGGAF